MYRESRKRAWYAQLNTICYTHEFRKLKNSTFKRYIYVVSRYQSILDYRIRSVLDIIYIYIYKFTVNQIINVTVVRKVFVFSEREEIRNPNVVYTSMKCLRTCTYIMKTRFIDIKV